MLSATDGHNADAEQILGANLNKCVSTKKCLSSHLSVPNNSLLKENNEHELMMMIVAKVLLESITAAASISAPFSHPAQWHVGLKNSLSGNLL